MTVYRADIDGLRAISVLGVLFFHVGIPGFSGGYVGVDVFFVISGYVITLRLAEDLKAGEFSILSFYERRIRRLFPALICVLAACWIAALVLFSASYFDDFSKSLRASALFVSNIYFWRASGYFDNSALLRPLLHTWSLSVEEQFYLVMPIAMFLAYRFLRKRLTETFAVVAMLSLALSIFAGDTAPTANFYLLPTRAWELLLGTLLATSGRLPYSRGLAEGVGIAGLALVLAPIHLYDEATPFPGLTALPSCLGAVLLIYSGGSGPTLAKRLLSFTPLVFIGLISYSLYLIHWPMIVFTRYATLQEPTSFGAVAIIASSVALAFLSWRFVERPLRHQRKGVPRSRVIAGGAVSMGLVALLGAAPMVYGPTLMAGAAQSTEPKADTWRTGKCFLMSGADLANWTAEACALSPGKSENVLLWGDSFAAHYVPGLIANAPDATVNFIQYTAAGCPPVLSYYSYARPHCRDFNQNVSKLIKDHDIKAVVLAARWRDIQQRGLQLVGETIDMLTKAGVEVWLVGQSPEFIVAVQTVALNSRAAANGAWDLAFDPRINDRLRGYSGPAHFIDPLSALCSERRCRFRDGEQFLFADYGHFSGLGSARAVRAYFPYIRRNGGSEALGTTGVTR